MTHQYLLLIGTVVTAVVAALNLSMEGSPTLTCVIGTVSASSMGLLLLSRVIEYHYEPKQPQENNQKILSSLFLHAYSWRTITAFFILTIATFPFDGVVQDVEYWSVLAIAGMVIVARYVATAIRVKNGYFATNAREAAELLQFAKDAFRGSAPPPGIKGMATDDELVSEVAGAVGDRARAWGAGR